MFSTQDIGGIEKINYESIINTVVFRINTAYAEQNNQAYIKNVHCLKDLLSPYFSYYYKDVFKKIAGERSKNLRDCLEGYLAEEVMVESWRQVYLTLLKILRSKGLLLKERRGLVVK